MRTFDKLIATICTGQGNGGLALVPWSALRDRSSLSGWRSSRLRPQSWHCSGRVHASPGLTLPA